MQGYVLSFHPTTGVGTVVTESGRACPFRTVDRQADLCGGDLVRCQVQQPDLAALPMQKQMMMMKIELLERATDRLASFDDPVAKELFHTVQMETAGH